MSNCQNRPTQMSYIHWYSISTTIHCFSTVYNKQPMSYDGQLAAR